MIKKLTKFLCRDIIRHEVFKQGYRQVGKARDSESRMRWFESSYPCHFFVKIFF